MTPRKNLPERFRHLESRADLDVPGDVFVRMMPHDLKALLDALDLECERAASMDRARKHAHENWMRAHDASVKETNRADALQARLDRVGDALQENRPTPTDPAIEDLVTVLRVWRERWPR